MDSLFKHFDFPQTFVKIQGCCGECFVTSNFFFFFSWIFLLCRELYMHQNNENLHIDKDICVVELGTWIFLIFSFLIVDIWELLLWGDCEDHWERIIYCAFSAFGFNPTWPSRHCSILHRFQFNNVNVL